MIRMYEPGWEYGPSEEELAGAVGLLDPEPTQEERDFLAELDAAELARWNAPEGPAEIWPEGVDLARRACAAEVLIRKAQAVMLREVHALAAASVAADAAFAGGMRHEAEEFAADEVAVALGVPRHTARDRIDDAYALVEACPRTLACLEAGILSYPVAALLARETAFAPDGQRGVAEAMTLDRLAGADLPGLGRLTPEQIARTAILDPDACWRVAAAATPGRARRAARRVLTALDADRPERRRRTQPGPIDITAYPTRPGWMMLGLEMPEADGCTAQARLHALARLLKRRPGETRTLGELRVQAFHDILFGHTPPDHRPDGPSGLPVPVPFDVHLTVDAAGRTADPRYGELSPGTLQVILDAATSAGGNIHVRALAAQPCPGTHPDPDALAAEPDRRHPTRTLAAAVRMRSQTCAFPGCSIPAGRTDLDHSIPWPHGPTCACNLCCLCRHHHRLKTKGRWTVVNHGDGHLTWTTPTGRVVHTHPDP